MTPPKGQAWLARGGMACNKRTSSPCQHTRACMGRPRPPLPAIARALAHHKQGVQRTVGHAGSQTQCELKEAGLTLLRSRAALQQRADRRGLRGILADLRVRHVCKACVRRVCNTCVMCV